MATAKKSTAREAARAPIRRRTTAADKMKSVVSARPLVTLGIAAGVGILLGLLVAPISK